MFQNSKEPPESSDLTHHLPFFFSSFFLCACSGLDLYTASDYLPKYLTTPSKGASYDVACTPWQDAVGTSQARWEWLEEILAPGTVAAEDKNEATSKSAYPGAFGNTLKETLEQAEKQKEVSVSTGVPRPEHKIFGLAMLGGGRITGEAHLHGKYCDVVRSFFFFFSFSRL